MKKSQKIIKSSIAIAVVLALLCLYFYRIPSVYTCYPDQPPATSSLYTLEAVQQETDRYTAKVKLFGLLPIKDATVHKITQKSLVVLGVPFGVKLYTKGVIVIDAEEESAGVKAGIQVGDIILSYNNKEVRSNEELKEQVQLCQGKKQKVTLLRNNRTQTLWVTPSKTEEGYFIGLWVRDSTAGLGTLTYYDPQTGAVAGLGHSIADVDTGLTMPVESGTLVTANIQGARAGEKGDPGELLGTLTNQTFGKVTANNEAGLFGISDQAFEGITYPIALKEEVQEGEAQILCTLDGTTPQAYTIRITKVNNNLSELKNLCIQVTDERLLKETGGIVQGMCVCYNRDNTGKARK